MKRYKILMALILSLTQRLLVGNWLDREIARSICLPSKKNNYRSITFHNMFLPILTCYISPLYDTKSDMYDYYILLSDSDTTKEFKGITNKIKSCHGWNVIIFDECDNEITPIIVNLDKDDSFLQKIFSYDHLKYCYCYKISFPKKNYQSLKLQLTKKRHKCIVALENDQNFNLKF